MNPAGPPTPPVRRRIVFYLSGFDPRGVRYYYGLFRDQAANFSRLSGEAIEVSPRRRIDRTLSSCNARNATEQINVELRFLRWEDIVSAAWIRDPLDLAWRAARTYANYLRHSDWPWVLGLPRGPLTTLFYPPLLSLLVPLLLALPLLGIGLIWLRWWLALPLALLLGFATAIPLLVRIKAFWLLRFFVFNSEEAGGTENPVIASRLDLFADLIARTLGEEPADEVLLVAHSNGSILAMPLMDRLIARTGAELPDRFALVTLGHCVPLVSGRKDAVPYHAVLRRLAAARFRWLDIGSPTDGAAYAGINPLLKHSANPAPDMTLLSPRWYKFFDRAPGKIAWNKKYDNHFNYLRTADRLSPIDYPSLVLSNRCLANAIAAFRAIA